jgi:hypothetical protein
MDKQFTPNEIVNNRCVKSISSAGTEYYIRDAKYLGPHHNPQYAWIISHNCKKVTARWEDLSKKV